ncbi:hypothetical protein EV368DRAFT_68592 [Lentinula lateritia]|nr:hypothetical protein EV368DRAFT_68592 [Lentinula lateritia]
MSLRHTARFTPQVKEEYERRAERAKLHHLVLHPNYVYCPQRKVRAVTVAGGEEDKGKSRHRAKRGHKSKCNDDSSTQSFDSIVISNNDQQACLTGLRASSTSQEPLTALPIPLIPFTSQSYSEISTTHVSETQQSSVSQSNSPTVVQNTLFALNGEPDFDIDPLSDLDPKHLIPPLDDMGARIELKNALDSQPDVPQTVTSQINFWAWISSNPLFNAPSSTLDHIAPNTNPFDDSIVDQPQNFGLNNFNLNVMMGDIPEFNAYSGSGGNMNWGPSAFASDANTSAACNTTVHPTFDSFKDDPSCSNSFNPFGNALVAQPHNCTPSLEVSMGGLDFGSVQSGLVNFDANTTPGQADPPSLLNDLGVILQGLDDSALQNLLTQLGQQRLDISPGDTMNDTDTSDMNFLGYDAVQMNNAQAPLHYNNLVTDCAHTSSSEPSGSGLNSGYTTAQMFQSNYTQPPAQYHDANGGAVSSEHQMISVHPLANQASGSSVYAPFHDHQAQSFAFVENELD